MASRSVIRSPAKVAWRAAAVLVGAVLLVVASVAGVNAWNTGAGLNLRFSTIPDALPGEQDDERAGPARPRAAGERSQAGAHNILVLGVGSQRATSGKVSAPVSPSADTLTSIMVVNIPAHRTSVSVLSVLPSTSLATEGEFRPTVGQALDEGGVDAAVETVQTLIGAPVHHVAVVDVAALAVMIDAVGGVDPPGEPAQEMSGHEALDMIREPAPEGESGLSPPITVEAHRALVEQSVVRALFTSIEREGTFESLRKTAALAAKVSPFIAVDEGLTVGYLSSLRLSLRDLGTDIVFGTLPVVAGTSTLEGPRTGEPLAPDPTALAAVREAIDRDSLGQALRAGLTPGG